MIPNVSFSTLRMFEAAARLGSLKAAANELNITPSAVSQRVRLLEDQLGVAVFTRYYRRLELTETGASLCRVLTPAFADITSALNQIAMQQPSNTVRIAVYQTLASRWLVPMLPDLQTRSPGLSVEFETGMETVDFRNPKIDLAIRVSHGDFAGCSSMKLFDEVLAPVCTPDVAAQLGAADSLRQATLIYSSNRPNDWANWMDATSMGTLYGKSLLQFPNSSLAIDAAINGVGVALSQVDLVRSELNSGALVTPFEFQWKTGRSYFLLSPLKRDLSAAAETFRIWLEDWVSKGA